jgi:hypothetical protein
MNTKSCEVKKDFLDGGSVGSLRPLQRGTSQVRTVRHFVSSATGRRFDSDRQLVFKAPRFNRLGAFSFCGLLKEPSDSGVIRESDFLFTAPACAVGEGGDGQCERSQESGALSFNAWRSRIALRKFSSLSKRASSTKPLSWGVKIILSWIICTTSMTSPVTATSGTMTGDSAVSYSYFNCIRAIYGEAEAEPFSGKVAVAEAIRNRKSLKQVFGVSSKRTLRPIPSIWKECELAWEKSANSNLTNGAIGWGNAQDLKIFKRQKWFKNCFITKRIGNHYFYKRGEK